ncbi:UDP-glucose:undecaprenyl-phosphateglucose-1-phosphate transferase [Striga asiatica]|uniref:UDP-glucose:undecaprenyl-phosphateglucose-1-phosphate transferase n=1 Tax=Striga asiatica TaxID=4170 RepID=A0A5A7RDL6_STRAF|nr:UDP-glucose:undecaprenyl-phosphateglucose-1-phosphate transferase [Striga asiatica]
MLRLLLKIFASHRRAAGLFLATRRPHRLPHSREFTFDFVFIKLSFDFVFIDFGWYLAVLAGIIRAHRGRKRRVALIGAVIGVLEAAYRGAATVVRRQCSGGSDG